LASRVLRRPLAAVLVVVLGLAVVGGCSDDGSADADDRPTDTASGASGGAGTDDGAGGDAVLTSAGGAPAANGAQVDEPPGSPDRVPLDGFGEVAIAIEGPDGEVLGWCLLLAETEEQRQRGLMEVTDLQGYEGMIFVWSEDADSSFYMRNTPTPLSIGWVDAEGELVSTADMEPCADIEGCPLYPADGPYRFAIEVPQGGLDELGLVEGSKLTVGGQCAPATDSR
jgi:uncharacterized membrane protein (UPF0127 family)